MADATLTRALDERLQSHSLVVPTDDLRVQQRLRELKEPIWTFGERKDDRRVRLRECLLREKIRRKEAGEEEQEEEVRSESESEDEQEEEFFTEGTEELLSARRRLAGWSLISARTRHAHELAQSKISLQKIVARRREIYEPLKRYQNLGSQLGDTRPISSVRFSPGKTFTHGEEENRTNGRFLATASWGGSVKLWTLPDAKVYAELGGHPNERVTGLAWHPFAGSGFSNPHESVQLASAASDGLIKLWSVPRPKKEGEKSSTAPLSTLKGHDARVARISFHPTGSHLVSASYDGTWRLWDVQSGKELLVQEGHSKEVYCVDWHPDGGLVGSGGLDALGRLWDVRSGRSAMVLDGHAREILSLSFAPNGYQVATSSGDDTVRIWDLRQLRCRNILPVGKSSVSEVCWYKSDLERKSHFGRMRDLAGAKSASDDSSSMKEEDGEMRMDTSGSYLVTAGYDGLVKLWSADDFQLLRVLDSGSGVPGTADKVMSVDVDSEGQSIVSGHYGKTFKIWGVL
ncbi:WD40 repeat-like protein [Ceraceosorus guamensis]|uniref:WD40 repeat-like protein n=1 Tax=Ceraceosorus guamensis TaxID=1522189 RepID=A0A316VWS8_9BASI|nr:WD40 repeat-like protein [Ceraceosorus guamensis]PWN40903.1 WD40 repeat-like protein [Ceraceosorus guamensis]